MPGKKGKPDKRLLDRMRAVERRWSERDTAEIWDETTPVHVEPSPRRPEYLIAIEGPLAKALRTAARRSGEAPPDYARRVLEESISPKD